VGGPLTLCARDPTLCLTLGSPATGRPIIQPTRTLLSPLPTTGGQSGGGPGPQLASRYLTVVDDGRRAAKAATLSPQRHFQPILVAPRPSGRISAFPHSSAPFPSASFPLRPPRRSARAAASARRMRRPHGVPNVILRPKATGRPRAWDWPGQSSRGGVHAKGWQWSQSSPVAGRQSTLRSGTNVAELRHSNRELSRRRSRESHQHKQANERTNERANERTKTTSLTEHNTQFAK